MKKKIIIFIFTTLLISFKINALPKEMNNKNLLLNQKIYIEGRKRNYHIYLPNNYENKPVTILLHGNRGSANQVLGRSIINSPQKIWLDLAKKHEFILIIPNGSRGPKRHRGWNDCRSDAKSNPNSNDVLFIKQLLKKIKLRYKHNSKKVYVAGISNGGIMANRLAQEIPNKITAFASVIASMALNSDCTTTNVPVSALFMNGTADPILPYNGGHIASKRGKVKSTNQSIAYWVERNGTSTTAIETIFDDTNTSDNSSVIKYHYLNGINNTEVASYKIINGGHTEPSLLEHYGKLFKKIVGNQNKDFEMAEEIWQFFKDKTK